MSLEGTARHKMDQSVRMALRWGAIMVASGSPGSNNRARKDNAAIADANTLARRALQQALARSSRLHGVLSSAPQGRSPAQVFPDLRCEGPGPPGWRPGCSGSSAGRRVTDLRMSGIACQKVVKIYRPRPRLVNVLSRFVACFLPAFFHLSADTALKSAEGLMDFNKLISLKSEAPACQNSHFTAVIWSRCRQL